MRCEQSGKSDDSLVLNCDDRGDTVLFRCIYLRFQCKKNHLMNIMREKGKNTHTQRKQIYNVAWHIQFIQFINVAKVDNRFTGARAINSLHLKVLRAKVQCQTK